MSQPSINIQVRIATVDDRAAMMPAINQAFAIETFMEGTRTDEARLAEMMKTGEFLIAEDGRRIVASVYVEVRGRKGYLGMLAVDPAEQGKGLGRTMVDAAEGYFRERACTGIELVVVSLRPDLPPFYRRLGYVEAGTEEFRPSRTLSAGLNCHCIVMSKVLQIGLE